MADLVSGNLKEEKMLTRFNGCTWVALGVDTQPVESIEQEAEPGVPSSTFGGKQAQTEPPAVIRFGLSARNPCYTIWRIAGKASCCRRSVQNSVTPHSG